MRNKHIVAVAVALLACAVAGWAQTTDGAAAATGQLSLSAMPGVGFAMENFGLPAGTYGLSPQVNIDAEYRLGFLPLLFLKGGIGYRYAPLTVGPVLSLIQATAGVGVRYDLIPLITLKGYVAGGYSFGILSLPTENVTGGSWAARAGIDAQFNILPSLGVVAGGAIVVDNGVFLGLQAAVGATYSFGPAPAPKPAVEKPVKTKPEKLAPEETPKVEPKPTTAAGGLTIKPVFDFVFPVFHAWYDDNPLGVLLVTNGGKETMTGIQVSFYMKQFMDGAWTSETIARLEPGKEIQIPIKALFTQEILDINSSTKSLAEITVDYKVGNDEKQAKWSDSVRLQGRNEMTWAEDDRRAAAFVTQSDPAVMTFARNVASAVKGSGSSAINANLAKAMAIHEAMRAFQMTYMVDPKTPYKDLVAQKDALDRLQFPRETLQYKAGDCDDLSILYCALLESLAVKTAFITIPGHIYMAFATGLKPAEARAQFKRADELIFEGDMTWIPVEVTALGDKDDFLEAWLLGAKEWRENKARGQANLYPIEDAWQVFEPVSLPKDNAPPPVAPAAAQLVTSYQKTTIRFLDREMADQIAELQRKVTESKDDPKVVNKLGVLYARYGRYDEAKVQFKKASVKSKNYVSPLLNLGMISLEEGDLAAANDYYESARKIEPKNSQVLLGYARINHELENYGSVRTAYEELKKADPALAAQFAYLDLRGDEAARAADISGAKEVTLWADD
jgi:tetratricopeptide (TPR) repeat protein